jgi:hypothetical protein
LDLESDDMDPVIAVHTDCSSSSSMCNDDFGNPDSLFAMDVFVGVEYLIGVSSFAAKGEFVLTLDGPRCLEGDANGSGRPDACEDCNDNDVFDDEDISAGTSADANANGIPDECEDCNGNGALDSEDIAGGTSADCNRNGRPDECDLADGTSDDCNADGIPDECERRAIFAQAQDDCAVAEPVCPGILYDGSITGALADGTSSCDLPETGADVWYRYIPTSDGELIVGVQDAEFGPLLSIHSGCPGDEADELICDDYRFNVLPQVTMEVTAGQAYWIRIASYEGETGGFDVLLKGPGCTAADLNGNGVLDWYDIAEGTSTDCDGDVVPDDCEPDCNGNAVADACDIVAGTSEDCSGNGIPDECEPDCNINGAADTCDIIAGTSDDCDANGVPDECQTDSDGDMMIDACEWCDQDAEKVLPGACGCGSLDTDTDGDGTADCLDGCPEDPDKTEPGLCGCGVPDDATDSDGDLTIDCLESCPSEPALVEPSEPGVELTCDDGIDNDCDGAPDYADYNCVGYCVCGDLNYDQKVDLQDFGTLAACYVADEVAAGCTADNLHCCDLD